MWELAAALMIWCTPPLTPPYQSCIDGHIVENLSECPLITSHQHDSHAPIGGGPRRGLLGLGIGGIL